MVSLLEVKNWLKVDHDDDDNLIESLISVSKILIKQKTGVQETHIIGNKEATELYKLVQNLLITDLYENRGGLPKISSTLISLLIQLEAFILG